MEFLREIAHLRPRTNTFSAVFRVRSLVSFAIHKFFQEKGFVYVHTPIITASDCEGAGEMFRVTTLDMVNVPLDEKREGGTIQGIFSLKRPTSPLVDSLMSRLTVLLLGMYILSDQLSGRKIQIQLGMHQNFG